MADALWQDALAAHPLGFAHIVGAGVNFLEHGLNLRLVYTTCGISGNNFAQLLQTELHVVEVLDGFAQFNGNVCEHGLEFTECLTGGTA